MIVAFCVHNNSLWCVFTSFPVMNYVSFGLRLHVQVENDLKLFLSAVADTEGSLTELVERVWQHHGGEEKGLGVEGFLGWVLVEVEGEGRTVAVWRGLFACGYDLHFER